MRKKNLAHISSYYDRVMNLLSLSVFWLLNVVAGSPLDCVPRKYVPYHEVNARLFHEEGVFHYSTMLLREDLDLLVVGAQETVLALDLNNISKKRALVKWEATEQERTDCQNKGKDPETDCKNYIRILHKMNDKMLVCGTKAFDPQCDHMTFSDGHLTLLNEKKDGRGICPFNPAQRFVSLMHKNSLYSALYTKFLGSESLLNRSFPDSLYTEHGSFNEPNFVSMALISESETGEDRVEDKLYLFFSEKPVEFDNFNKMSVSRVARVCKVDQGGENTLRGKWTSFLKARIDCPLLDSQPPYIIQSYIIQDMYLWCDPQQQPKNCFFYAIFTPQLDILDMSAVCVYQVSDINRVFEEGDFKTPVDIDNSRKWVRYGGLIPSPRPGACVANSKSFPSATLEFVKKNALMDQDIQPVGGRPLLVRRGSTFTQIIVNQVEAADGEKHNVMFIGTVAGTILKAVNYDGEMFIIEEIQVFQPQEPIKILKFSNIRRQLYAGSNSRAAQIPVARCEKSPSCMECVLTRDPYCGWNTVVEKCVVISDSKREFIQSVKKGNASLCKSSVPSKPTFQSTWPGGKLMLTCTPPSNFAKIKWKKDNSPLILSDRVQQLKDRLLILNANQRDVGLYHCLSVERSKTNEYTTTVAKYQLSVTPKEEIVLTKVAWDALMAILVPPVILLFALLAWNFYKGYLPCPCT